MANPRKTAPPAPDRRIRAELRIMPEKREAEMVRTHARSNLERSAEEDGARERLEPADRECAQVAEPVSQAGDDEDDLDHEDAAAQILEQNCLDETPGLPVIELRDLLVELHQHRAFGLESRGETANERDPTRPI